MSNIKTVVTVDELRACLDRLPRLSLADLPTPLLDCPRLSKALDGPRILVKREDQTGMAFGGNKVREFEYSVAPAVEGGYDVLLHGAASQSNQSRLTAAVAARLGLKAVMVGQKDAHAEPVNGNLLLTHLFGAEVHLLQTAEEKAAVIEQLKSEGHRYTTPAAMDTTCEVYLMWMASSNYGINSKGETSTPTPSMSAQGCIPMWD